MANARVLGNSSMECLWGHIVVPICSPATAHLFKDQIDNSFTLTAFADNHSICNNFKAGNKLQEHKNKTDLEEAFTQLKYWMDTMHLMVNPNKTEYIFFGPPTTVQKDITRTN